MDSEPLAGTNPVKDREVIGREAELSTLVSALGNADRGRGSLHLLSGEPGIGKTTLASEFAEKARAASALVLWGRCWEGAGAPAYWPWIQAIRPMLRSTDLDTLHRWLGTGAPDVAQMLPELYDLFPEISPLPAREAEAARFQLFDSTATFLRNAAEQQPIVLVLDDVHSADKTSLLLLRFVAALLADTRIVVVGTFRPAELMDDNPLTEIAVDVLREPTTSEIRLTGLAEREVAEFLERATRQRPDPRLVSRLHDDTRGNPLYLEHALRLQAADGDLSGLGEAGYQHLPIPSRITSLIGRRVDQVSEHCQEALRLGTILGPEFGFEALRRLGDYTGPELLALLDEAAGANLLLLTRDSPATFGFPHDLVRETLYEGISHSERALVHARAAQVLEGLYGQDLDDHLAELAYHYFEAAPNGHAASALLFARRAGEQAVKSLAYEEAVRLHEMAISAYEMGSESDESLRVEILLDLGDAQTRAAEDQRAKATFLHAASLAKRVGDPSQLARAAFGYGGIFVWQRAGADLEMVPLLQEALMILGGADDQLRVRLLSRLACAMRDQPERETSDALSAEAVKVARALGDPATLCYALEGRIAAVMWPENPEYRLELSRELIEVAEQHGLLERVVAGHMFEIVTLIDLCQVAEARTKLTEMTRRARELRQPNQVAVTQMLQILLDLIEGDFATADATLMPVLEADYSNRDEFSSVRSHLFLLRREQSRLHEIEDFVRDSAAEFPWYPLHRSALACLLADLGRNDEARLVLDEIAQGEFALFHRDNEWLFGMSLAADACSKLGATETARVIYGQLSPFAAHHALGWAEGSVGAVDRYLGLLAATFGDDQLASAHFEDAININRSMGARPWTAHSQFDYARLLLRGPPEHHLQAEQILIDAAATARDLGMSRLIESIDEMGHAGDMADHQVQGARFFREGEFWDLEFFGESFRLKDTKGMRYLAKLLAAPGREIHVLDLTGSVGANRSGAAEVALTSPGMGPADDVIDQRARREYQQRLEELTSDLEEAEAWNDEARAESARSEIEFLTEALKSATGLGGRSRKTGSASERARVNVTRAIRSAIARVAENGEQMGQHLDVAISTGTFCSYTPDPRVPIDWAL